MLSEVLPYVGIIIQLIFLEGILSLDNAAVLGAMVSVLPDDQPVPWPRWMLPWWKPLDALLGTQRDAALKVGLLGAYVGRGLMLLVASWVVQNEWVMFLGGLYLVYLGISHLAKHGQHEEMNAQTGQPTAQSFWGVVLAVELADLAFSIDNVVAAVALSRELWVVLLGVAFGILTMRFAATLFARLVQREPVLEPTAYLLVFAVGLTAVLEIALGIHTGEAFKFFTSAGILGLALLYPRVPLLHLLDPLLHAFQRLFQLIMWAISLLLSPFTRLAGSRKREVPVD